MKHTRLGRTGLQVSRLCLGTMTFGLQCDEPTSVAIMDRASDGGITFFDTADVYPLGGTGETVGRTEEIVGRWLKGRRDRFILATKCFGRSGPARWDQGNSRKHILDAVDASLRRLQTDYIDLYQLHGPDPETPDRRDDARARGRGARGQGALRRAVRTSSPTRSRGPMGRSEALGVVRFDSVQPRYNMLFREIERELLPLCRGGGHRRHPLQPDRGRAAERQAQPRRGPEEGSRFTLGTAAQRYQDRYWHEGMFETVEQLRPLAAIGGHDAAADGGGVGAREPGDHRADHRRQPAGAARRHDARGGDAAGAGAQAAPGRTHRAIPARRRGAASR